MSEQRRATDSGLMCRLALRAAQFWDFIDKRDVDKHAVTMVILFGTWELTRWAMHFAAHGDRPGIEVAAIIGAVVAPYMGLQAAAIAWYFKARQ
jgi:hypothetical protein